MATKSDSPTEIFYNLLVKAYDIFNQELFERKLPACLITVQRKNSVMGYFSANRWASPDGRQAHEIALNPAYFNKLIEVLQTLAHEQTHLWQHEFGRHKSLKTYHNKEFATKMLAIGLLPTSTGEIGGAQTGQKMSDLPIRGGKFIKACEKLLRTGFELPWVDRFPAYSSSCQVCFVDPSTSILSVDDAINEDILSKLLTSISDILPQNPDNKAYQEAARDKQKIRYHCENCDTNVWGKPGLNIFCGDCGEPYYDD